MNSETLSGYKFSRSQKNRRFTNLFMLSSTGLLTILALIPLFWIVGYVVYRGSKAINLAFFTQLPKPLGVPGGGVLPAIEGTLLLALLASTIAIPIGVFVAFYVVRFPHTLLGIAVRFGTDILAGVPSIIVGLFGYTFIVKVQGHYSAFAGGAVLAMIMLPTIIRTTEEMVKLVPQSLREASLALGAPEWKTSLSVILPAASNGIITGFLLSLARATGETAPLLFTTLGNEQFEIGRIITNGVQNKLDILTIISRIFSQPIDSLPLALYKYAQQPFPERVELAWATAFVLLSMVLLTNILSRMWVYYHSRKLRK